MELGNFPAERLRFRLAAHYDIHYNQYTMPMHNHARHELMYIVSGRCRIALGKEQNEGVYGVGEYVFVRAGYPHRLLVAPHSPCRILNVEFDAEKNEEAPTLKGALRSFTLRSFLEQLPNEVRNSDDGAMFRVMQSLHLEDTERDRSEGEGGTMQQLLLARLLLLLARQTAEAASLSPYVEQAAAYIDENYHHELSVAQIAAACSVSPAHLQRLFARQRGLSLMEYVCQKRLQKAKLLLEMSDMSITDIAFEAGFNSRQYFSQSFRAILGCSPSQYRREGSRSGRYTRN